MLEHVCLVAALGWRSRTLYEETVRSSKTSRITLVKIVGATITALGFASCGDDGDGGPSPTERPDAGSEPADPGDSPLYVVGGVFLGPAPSVYVTAVDSLDADTVVDPEQGLQFSRFPGVSSPGPGSSLLFVGLDESPTMQRYRVTEERVFVLEDEVSFQPLGLQSAGRFRAEFVAPDKAYFIDRPS